MDRGITRPKVRGRSPIMAGGLLLESLTMTAPNGRRADAASPAKKATMYVKAAVPLKNFVHKFAEKNGLSLSAAAEIIWIAGRDALRANPPDGLSVPQTPGPKKRTRVS
jgi:hypothetical protein